MENLEVLIDEIVKRVEEEAGEKMQSPEFLGCVFPPGNLGGERRGRVDAMAARPPLLR